MPKGEDAEAAEGDVPSTRSSRVFASNGIFKPSARDAAGDDVCSKNVTQEGVAPELRGGRMCEKGGGST